MKKLILSIAVIAALSACSKDEAKKSNDEVIKETISSDDFKNLDKDAQAIVLRALSDKEGTGSTEVANNDTSGNVDDTELTPEEQAMDDGSGLTTEDNGATVHFGNGWTLFKEGTTNFEIRKIVEEAGPVYRYMGDIDGNRVTMVFTCARPTKPATSVVLFAMAMVMSSLVQVWNHSHIQKVSIVTFLWVLTVALLVVVICLMVLWKLSLVQTLTKTLSM